MKYGIFEEPPGEYYSNSPGIEVFITPCCYSNQVEGDTECSLCGAPIRCEFETETVKIAVCTIRYRYEDK